MPRIVRHWSDDLFFAAALALVSIAIFRPRGPAMALLGFCRPCNAVVSDPSPLEGLYYCAKHLPNARLRYERMLYLRGDHAEYHEPRPLPSEIKAFIEAWLDIPAESKRGGEDDPTPSGSS